MKKLNKLQNLNPETNDKTNFTKLIDQVIERKIESNIGGDVVIVSMFVAKSVDSLCDNVTLIKLLIEKS